jgi:hypothetical protein
MNDSDREQWRLAGALFHEFVELDPTDRSERLSRLGNTDPVMKRAVEALLAGDAAADERLPNPGFGLSPLPDGRGPLRGPAPSDPLGLAGRTISHFRVRERLASGGMGVVYRADDLRLGRPVALKFPLPLHASTSERFLREAQSAGALDHPNLCPVYEISDSPEGLFLAMPLYGGQTLKDHLAGTGALSIDEALAIAEQVATGLGFAHKAGVVHRDIKPGNVMLLPGGAVKVLDFGLAKIRGPDESSSSGVLGTLSYLTPEQIRRQPTDARADLWAMGVMLYEMIGGTRPFAGEHDAAILHAILHEAPRPLSELRPDLPAGLEALVSALLRKDPETRYTGAVELAEAIGAIRRGATPRWSRRLRRRVRVGLAAASLLGLTAAGWVASRDQSLISAGALAERDVLVVADFDVGGPDSTLGPLLARELRRLLGTSRVVTIMPQGQVDAALRRIRRPAGTRLDPALAREVAQRERARAVVQGTLAPLGAGYLMTVGLVAAGTGNELVSVAAAAPQETDILPALEELGRKLRRRIGESFRDAGADPSPHRRLTTSSLEALRLYEKTSTLGMGRGERLANLRAAVALDSSFAYAWFVIGNHIPSRHRTPARDSALAMAYRHREGLTPFEHAQVSSFYWNWVELDRRQAMAAFDVLLASDSMNWRVVLNHGDLLVRVREFQAAERLLRLHHGSDSVGSTGLPRIVDALVGQGKITAADSFLARDLAVNGPDSALDTRIRLAVATLSCDSAASIARRHKPQWTLSFVLATLAGCARVRGKLAEAHRLDAKRDSVSAEDLKIAGVAFDPAYNRALPTTRDEVWLLQEPRRALDRLDRLFAAHPARSVGPIQDRMDAMRAASLYAAAGRPAVARSIVDAIMATADSLAQRAVHPLRLAALGEIALAKGRPREAMQLFRGSDLAADGLPATRCAACILPALARAAERAGWADSARIFWERYVTTPSLDRLEADQWFLAMAYRKLAELYAATGDRAKTGDYSAKLVTLWRDADPELRKVDAHTALTLHKLRSSPAPPE